MTRILTLALLLAGGGTVWGEVLDRAASGFSVRNVVSVPGDRNQAFAAFVGEVGSWWSPEHTFFGNASNLSIEAVVNGCFCERGESGRQLRHLEVIFVDPGKLIKLVGGLGPLQDYPVNGVMSVTFRQTESGSTEVEMTYRVSGYVKDGLEEWADPVDSVLAQQLTRFSQYMKSK